MILSNMAFTHELNKLQDYWNPGDLNETTKKKGFTLPQVKNQKLKSATME